MHAYHMFSHFVIDLVDEIYDCVRGSVHVRTRRERVETNGVELIRILHRQLRERLEVVGLDGLIENHIRLQKIRKT